ncbi:MAG TPA: hypothetical protein VFH80_29145 [Solirubrobacteraceae bacterium]|nr:hypothetical protein [Solirubrobacteraceae bacterium]
MIVILVGLLSLSACGGSSHSSTSSSTTHTAAANPEQTRLLSELRSGLEDPSSPVANVRDLDECIVQQAKRLPLASLRKLAAGDVGTGDTDPLVARCVAQGKGLSWVRGVVAGVVAGKLTPPIPDAFRKCVVAGVGTLTPAQLSAALNQEATGNQALSQRLGRRLALTCIKKPGIYEQWRKLWVGEIRSSLNGRQLPASFVQCVLHKAGQIGATDLIKLVQAGSAAETAYGEKLGRACRSSLSG